MCTFSHIGCAIFVRVFLCCCLYVNRGMHVRLTWKCEVGAQLGLTWLFTG